METNNCKNPQCFCDGSCKGIVKSDIDYSVETNKVIEQKERGDIEIRYNSEFNEIELEQDYPLGGNDLIYIEDNSRTEVAKAIDPKYQELEDGYEFLMAEQPVNIAIRNENKTLKDRNAKLLEALDKLMILNLDHYRDIAGLVKNAVQVIQQSETKSKDNE